MAWMQNSDSIETEVLLRKEFVFERYEPNLSQRNKLLCDFVATLYHECLKNVLLC